MRFLFVVFFILIANCACGQFADIPSDEKTVAIGISGDRGSQTHAATAVVPLQSINGWIGVHGIQTLSDQDVISEIYKARVQGGLRLFNVGLDGFLDTERNKQAGTSLQTQIGYFFRPAVYQTEHLRISGGVGNFVENTQARKELKLKSKEEIDVRWIAFASVGYRGITTLIKITPEIALDDFEFSLDPSIDFELSENVSLGTKARLSYESQPLTESWQVGYSAVLKLSF